MVLRIALFHPWLKSFGGAEKVVLDILKKSKHKIDIYTWSYERENTFSEFKKYKIRVIAPKIAKKFSRTHLMRSILFPLGIIKKIPLKKYDLFFISTSGLAEFVTFRNSIKNKTIAYIHTPLRDANKKIIRWNLENKYKNKFLKKEFYLFATKIYRFLEKRAWKKLNLVIFNSELSLKRAHEHNLLNEKIIRIIHPPIKKFNLKSKKNGKYFIYISRLNPPKRQDLLIKAWKNFVEKNPSYKLIFVGNAENKNYVQYVKRLASKTKNIEIKSNLEEKDLKTLIQKCTAGLFLGYYEDFGIVPLEILSAGKPLIAVDQGGYIDLIKKHPQFYKIKEKHSEKEMILEIEKSLDNFIKKYKKNKKIKKIKIDDFSKKIDSVLERYY